MPKVIVCIGPTQVTILGTVTISYTASVIGPPSYSYGAEYVVDTGITLNANLIAWRAKIIAQALERGVTLLAADVITFGAPT